MFTSNVKQFFTNWYSTLNVDRLEKKLQLKI